MILQPYNTTQGGTLAFYASANVTVPTYKPEAPAYASSNGEADGECPEELPLGSLCLIDNKPKAQGEFSEEDKQLLKDLAYMVGQEVSPQSTQGTNVRIKLTHTRVPQFKLGFESARREVEQERSDFLAGFLDSTLVPPSSPGSSPTSRNKNKDPLAACNLQQQRAAPSTRAIQSERSILQDFQQAAVELKDLTKSSAAAFFDLRSFRAPLRTDYELPFLNPSSSGSNPRSADMGSGRSVAGSSRPPSPRKEDSKPLNAGDASSRRKRSDKTSTGLGRVYLLGGSGSVDWEETAAHALFLPSIVNTLDNFYRVRGSSALTRVALADLGSFMHHRRIKPSSIRQRGTRR